MNQTEKILTPRISGWVTSIIALTVLIIGGYNSCTLLYDWYKNGTSVSEAIGSTVITVLVPIILIWGNVTLKRNEAVVYMFYGQYKGTLHGPTYACMPFWWSAYAEHDLSIKTMEIPAITVNDKTGNPIIIGCNIYCRVKDTCEATFAVTDINAYLRTKGEVALRNIAKKYPMDSHDENVISLRGSSSDILEALSKEISGYYAVAGYELEENPVGLTTLTYAPEIASSMLQRQQAISTLEARDTIAEGAVQIIKKTIENLEKEKVVTLSFEAKEKLVSSMLVTMCSHSGVSNVLSVK